MAQPAVTVVVPSFNSGHFLAWTLQSIAAQTLRDFECIVVDDASTDDSIAQARAVLKDPRFRVLRHRMNAGLSASRNTGLRAARSDHVAFLDADDLMMANSLEVRLAACLAAREISDRYAGSYCGSIQIEETLARAPKSVPQKLAAIDFLTARAACPFNANQPMLRRDVLRRCGGFNEALRQAEDFDLWQRILRAGYMFAAAEHTSVTYRKRAGSMVRRQPLMHLETSLAIMNSANRPAAPDQVDWSPHRLSKPLSTYLAQQGKAGRIFEFVGMALPAATADDQAQLIEIVHREVPDYEKVTEFSRAVRTSLLGGIRRQKGAISDSDAADADLFLARLSLAPPPAVDEADTGEAVVYGDAARDRPWFGDMQRKVDIVFIPHSAYHVWTISMLAPVLQAEGIAFITVDISPQWRDGGVRDAASAHGVDLIGLSEFVLGQFAPRAIVVFNDWDPVTRPILVAAKASGLRTIAIVEGIQDYDDADVHWTRHAYKTADVVLLPGDFDRKYFTGHDARVEVAGVPRIEALRNKPVRNWSRADKPRVLINSNFSYGVLENARDAWLTACVEAVRAAGYTPVISRHPADKGTLFPDLVSTASFYDLLETCDVSIQRFASGILEALARQVGVIYFNPHGEKVDKFQDDPMDAYVVATSAAQLKAALQDHWGLHLKAEANGGRFLDHHAGSIAQGAIARCTHALIRNLSSRPAAASLGDFSRRIEVLDLETEAFLTVRKGGDPIFPDPAQAGAVLERLCESWRREVEHGGFVRAGPAPLSGEGASAAAPDLDDAAFLKRLSALLLLDPRAGEDLARRQDTRLRRAVASVAADDPALQHYHQVQAHVRGKGAA